MNRQIFCYNFSTLFILFKDPEEVKFSGSGKDHYATADFVNLALGDCRNFLRILQGLISDKKDPGRARQTILEASLLPHRPFGSGVSHNAIIPEVA